jgi:proteasome lid subunit RPN8/RPN11
MAHHGDTETRRETAGTVRISVAAVEAIEGHAREGYPFEICGFLVGLTTEAGRDIREAWPVRNAWEESAELRAEMLAGIEAAGGTAGTDRWEAASEERRFLVSPQDTVRAMKRSRDAGMDLIGVYHTHPNHPAIPSDFDRDAAWPEWSYVIVSVREGQVADFRSWTLVEDGSRFEEELVERG